MSKSSQISQHLIANDPNAWELPKNWQIRTLETICDGKIANGFFKKPELVGSGYYLVNVSDLYQELGIDLRLVERVAASEKERQKYSIEPGDCFFTRSSLVLSGIAHCNIIRKLPEPALFECHLMRVRPHQNWVDPVYLAIWCRSPWAKKFFMGRAKQVTMTTIAQPDIAPLPIPLPPKIEQQEIVNVLDAVDDEIATTTAHITKLKQAKAGLLHDLLTRGIDENGELRDPIKYPEKFQDSALGKLPKNWEVEPLGKYTRSSAFGPRFSSDLYAEDGNVATLRTTDMDDQGALTLSSMPLAKLDIMLYQKHLLEKGDLLISRSGTCGITSVFPGFELPVLPGAFLIRFRFTEELISDFIQRYFNWESGRRRVLLEAEGGVQKNLKGSSLLRLHIPVPPYKEQQRILEKLQQYELQILTKKNRLKKLKLAKTGLMSDLLTGRVRVKLDSLKDT